MWEAQQVCCNRDSLSLNVNRWTPCLRRYAFYWIMQVSPFLALRFTRIASVLSFLLHSFVPPIIQHVGQRKQLRWSLSFSFFCQRTVFSQSKLPLTTWTVETFLSVPFFIMLSFPQSLSLASVCRKPFPSVPGDLLHSTCFLWSILPICSRFLRFYYSHLRRHSSDFTHSFLFVF